MKNSPPKKQIIAGNNTLAWSADKFGGTFDLERVLTLVCRVRNNLFHGGEFPEGPEADISRDAALVDAGITIMQTCLNSDQQLKQQFMEELA